MKRVQADARAVCRLRYAAGAGMLLAVGLLINPAICRADDYGDSAATAFALSSASNNLAGTIDNDVDHDWFALTALPAVTYSVNVSTGTLWDSTVSIMAPDGKTSLVETSSVGSGVAAQITWTNNGPIGTYYVQVKGFAEFTTGTYSLAVNRLNFTDANSNGILDSWETQYFGNLDHQSTNDTDHDGITDLQEYYMGTNPTNFGSGLAITDIKRGTNLVTVYWQAVPLGTYRVSAYTNFAGPWTYLVTNVNISSSPVLTHIDIVPPFTGRFYRVEFLY